MRKVITLLSALISFHSMAQEIAGRVLDEKKEPVTSAVIQVFTGGILKGGTVTDYDGNYLIKPLEPGYYDVLVIYSGYDSIFTNKVLVSSDKRTSVNFCMSKINSRPKIIISDYKKPLAQQCNIRNELTKAEIEAITVHNVCVNLVVGNYELGSHDNYFWGGDLIIRDLDDLLKLIPGNPQIWFADNKLNGSRNADQPASRLGALRIPN